MSQVETGNNEGADNAPSLDTSETFDYTLADGAVITVGKPRGVLKMRIKQILGRDHKDDAELKSLATAFLSIQKVAGAPMPPLQNMLQLEGFMNRFGSDEELDTFMTKFSRLCNPEETKLVQETLLKALELGLNDEQTTEFIREQMLPLAKARIEALRD